MVENCGFQKATITTTIEMEIINIIIENHYDKNSNSREKKNNRKKERKEKKCDKHL